MSSLFERATHKVKKRIGQAVDRLRPSSSQEHSRSTSPASSQLAEPAADGVSSLQPKSASPDIPAYARPPSPPTILATTGSAVKGLLAAAHDGSDLFPPLQIALGGVLELWDVFDRTSEAKGEFTKLESRLVAFKAIANAHQDQPGKVDENLRTRLASITQAVQNLWEAVELRQARGGFARVMQSSIDLDDIKTLVDAISSLLEVFQFESSIAVEQRLGLIVERLEEDRIERLAKERAEKRDKVIATIKSVLGENFVSEAADDEQPTCAGCMTGTREGVLSKLVAWVKDDPMAIFWLAGMAGTGKTSIAVTLCRMLRNDPEVLLGGGYFCSRSAGSITRTDVRHIIPTLAALLADQSQEFAESLATELEKDRRVGHKPVVEQIDVLLRKPLATLTSVTQSIVFVIDALDECSSERELAELLRLLADFESDVKVKFILTSRPELHIRGTPISEPDHNAILQLHTISTEEVMSDIRLYVSGTLKDAAPNATWYTNQDIDLLVKLSDGLFIYASTVLKYVLHCEEDEDRQDRLRKATSATTKRTAATSSIDKIYELVLVDASQSDNVDEDELERMKHILACILSARASLSVEALATLTNITPGRLRGSLGRLHSLVYLPVDNEIPGLRMLHASFGDYLFERGPQHIRIPASLGHDIFAHGCLKRLAQDDLCFNISQSRSSFEPNPKTAPDWIPLPLIYACLHWAHHVDAASNRSAFDEIIGRTFRSKFLFWLEVLSVMGKVGIASGLLRIAGSAVKIPVVSQFLRDANAFVASSHVAISRSAPHIYTSALPFAAKDSLVYQDFTPLYGGIISATPSGIDRHGGHLVATLIGHEDKVVSIAYSPDGQLLASASHDGTIRIWDIRTAEEVSSPLRSNDGKICSVAYSPDGQHVISGGAGEAVHIWSVATGRATQPPLRGHTDWIQSVAYSPDGMLIASGSDDKTVRLWAAKDGAQVSIMTGHTDGINHIVFSPDGRLVASASVDNTIRLWNTRTNEAVGDPLTVSNEAVMCVGFSPDGKWLAAGLQNIHLVRIWNVETLEPTPVVINNRSTVMSLAFSPDGSKLVTSGLRNIRSWDPKSERELPGSLTGHSQYTASVAFAPDGAFLASGSNDHTIKIWDMIHRDEGASQPLQAHDDAIASVAVSHGLVIVTGSYDCSARVWNASSGEAMLQPLLGHSGPVRAVTVSSDARFIASASADHSIRLWDAKTSEPVGQPLLGHDNCVNAVVFSSDDRWLASGADDRVVRVWDVETKQAAPFCVLECKGMVFTVAFSPDGRFLAVGDYDGYLHIWKAGTDQEVQTPLQITSKGIYNIAFSPDSKKIVVGTEDHLVRVLTVEGSQVLELEGHFQGGGVCAVGYSPDGLYIVSAGDDKTVRLWDTNTGTNIATLFGHGGWILSVAFTRDGKYIVSGGNDNTIHTWDLELALSLQARAEQDPLARLGSAVLDDDGWLVGPSNELLLWLPADYQGHVQLTPCVMVIGSYRIVLAFNDGVYWGDQWAQCLRSDARRAIT